MIAFFHLRHLNLLGENADLFAANSEGLLNLIKEYFDSHATEGELYCPTQQYYQ